MLVEAWSLAFVHRRNRGYFFRVSTGLLVELVVDVSLCDEGCCWLCVLM